MLTMPLHKNRLASRVGAATTPGDKPSSGCPPSRLTAAISGSVRADSDRPPADQGL